MKKFLKSLIVLVAAFFMFMASINVYAVVESNDENEYFNSYKQALETMKKGMESAPTTGDATVDFLYQMIPHHEAAVNMSEDILKYGSNEDVKRIAKTIVDEENKGITKLQDILKSLKDNLKVDVDNEKEYLKVYGDAYKEMISEMESIKSNENFDKHFLQAMIFHHEGAIKMAESILKHTYNDEVKGMAEKMVQSQSSQINEMKSLMKKIK